MADPHVITALIKRRAEIAGQIEHHQDSLRQAIVDLDNVDHTIRLFDPEIDLVEIRPKPVPPRNQAYQGEMTRVLLSVLRRATGPLTSYQLTQYVMAERGLPASDKRLARTFIKRVGSCLRHHRNKGLVKSEMGADRCLVWEVVRLVQ